MENALNNKYTKILSATGAATGIVYSIIKKTGFWKGVGNYFIFAITGSLIGAAIYELTTKEL